MLTLKNCVRVFSGSVEARILELCIHMDNESLYQGIMNLTLCFYASFYLSIFMSFWATCVHPELFKLEF